MLSWSHDGVVLRARRGSGTGAPPLSLPPPPPEELAVFYALVEKQTTASVLCRYTRAAELSERGAKHAERLWGSLMVAILRVSEAMALRGMAGASTATSEKEALRRRAWAILTPSSCAGSQTTRFCLAPSRRRR